MGNACNFRLSVAREYRTPVTLVVRDARLGYTMFVIKVALFAFILVYEVAYNHNLLRMEPVSGTVTVKAPYYNTDTNETFPYCLKSSNPTFEGHDYSQPEPECRTTDGKPGFKVSKLVPYADPDMNPNENPNKLWTDPDGGCVPQLPCRSFPLPLSFGDTIFIPTGWERLAVQRPLCASWPDCPLNKTVGKPASEFNTFFQPGAENIKIFVGHSIQTLDKILQRENSFNGETSIQNARKCRELKANTGKWTEGGNFVTYNGTGEPYGPDVECYLRNFPKLPSYSDAEFNPLGDEFVLSDILSFTEAYRELSQVVRDPQSGEFQVQRSRGMRIVIDVKYDNVRYFDPIAREPRYKYTLHAVDHSQYTQQSIITADEGNQVFTTYAMKGVEIQVALSGDFGKFWLYQVMLLILAYISFIELARFTLEGLYMFVPEWRLYKEGKFRYTSEYKYVREQRKLEQSKKNSIWTTVGLRRNVQGYTPVSQRQPADSVPLNRSVNYV